MTQRRPLPFAVAVIRASTIGTPGLRLMVVPSSALSESTFTMVKLFSLAVGVRSAIFRSSWADERL